MRIIAGKWRARPRESPPGTGTRPTADRVRETLFSMLASRIGSFADLRVADLFAGSGALGLEALSRGAAEAVFVETDRNAAATIRSNAERLGITAKIISGSAFTLQPSEPFDLIFADPPYAPGSGSALIASVVSAGWLAPSGWLGIETERGEELMTSELKIDVSRDVSRARLTLLRWP